MTYFYHILTLSITVGVCAVVALLFTGYLLLNYRKKKAWIANELAKFESQSKGTTYKDNMQYGFSDSLGRRYFYFPDMKKMPLAMLEKLQELQEQLQCKIPGRDLDTWIEKVKVVLNDDKKKDKVTAFGYWLGVLEERRSILFDPTLLTEIAALLYIREDENPCSYNAELHKEKFQMLWDDSQKGGKLYDFFQHAGLSRYIPSENITRENWEEYLANVTQKTERFKSLMLQTSALLSESGISTSSSTKT